MDEPKGAGECQRPVMWQGAAIVVTCGQYAGGASRATSGRSQLEGSGSFLRWLTKRQCFTIPFDQEVNLRTIAGTFVGNRRQPAKHADLGNTRAPLHCLEL